MMLESTYERMDRNDSIEVETHKAIQRATGITPKTGMFLPLVRDLEAGVLSAGGAMVQTDVDRDIRKSFLPNSVCGKATIVTNLDGNYRRPYFATSASPLPVTSEGSTVSDQSNQTFGALTLAPVGLPFSTLISRQSVAQSPSLQPAVLDDFRSVGFNQIEKYALGGSGLPITTGILSSPINPNSSNTDFSKTNFTTVSLASTPTNVNLAGMVAAVEGTNANDDGTFLLVTSPSGLATLRTTSVGSANTRFLVENGKVLGDDRLPIAASQYLTGSPET